MSDSSISPEDKYGPELANLLQRLAHAVREESGASDVVVNCEFEYTKARRDAGRKGLLRMKVRVSKDAKTIRVDGGKQVRRKALVIYTDVEVHLCRIISRRRGAKP